MDVNTQKGMALVFAHVAWVVSALYLYLTTPGVVPYSFAALAFIFGGMLIAGPLFGMAFHSVQRAIASRLVAPVGAPAAAASRMTMAGAVVVIVEAILIFVVADWSFRTLETARLGYPIEYAGERASFNAAIATFANANLLEEQAKLAREAGKADAEMETQVVSMIEQGLNFGRGVNDPFLAYLDPELPERYRTELVRGYEMLVQGRRNSDLEMQTAGNELVRKFYQEFLPTRVDTILGRMGSQAQ